MVLTRRHFLVAGAASVAAGVFTPYASAQKKAATLRVVPVTDLKILDPITSTVHVTRNHGYMVYDTLFAMDANLKVRPQMIEKYASSKDRMKWTFTLRDGLRFHDGQPVTAEDCVASVRRWSKKDSMGRLLAASTERMHATDKKTFTIELGKPFGPILEALAKPSGGTPFVMPARLASTSENEAIKDATGSGPFKFVKEEWQPGHQVVYVRNPDYVPRNEPPSGAAGGKHVRLDRVIWQYIPDPATANAALLVGEVDYWEKPTADFLPQLEQRPEVRVFMTDPRGLQGWVRPNHLHAPFNNKLARQALLHLVNQETYLQAAVGQPKYYRSCPAYFMCGTPLESNVGAVKPNLEQAKRLMAEAGYDGRPIVILDSTDIPLIHGAALITRDLLMKIGANVDLQPMDWGTLSARRAKKEPPKNGGWDILTTYFASWDVMNPAVNAGLSGACEQAWFGWYCSERMEKLRNDWVRAVDASRQKQIAEQIQLVAYDEVPYVPYGEFMQPDVYHKRVSGVLQFGVPLFWNVVING